MSHFPDRPLPKPYRAADHLRAIGRCDVANDNGKQAKLRRLTQRTRKLQPSVEQDFRLNVWLKTAPGIADGRVNIEYARMFVLNHALCLSEEHLLPFVDTLDTVLDKLEREQSNAIVQEMTR